MTLIPYKNLTIHAAPDFDAGQALNSNFMLLADFVEWTTQQFAGLDVYTTDEVDAALASKADVGHTHSAADVGAYAKSEVDAALAGKADAIHNHDGAYSPVGHTHSEYAPANHDHAGVYAPVDHDHAGVYASVGHVHTAAEVGAYTTSQVDTLLAGKAATDHEHDGIYSPVDHAHTADEVGALASINGLPGPAITLAEGENIALTASGSTITISSAVSGGGAMKLAELTDVLLSALAAGELLVHNGTAWTNGTLDEAGIAAADHTHDGVYAAADHAHTAADVGAYSTSQVDALLAGKANADHDHHAVYALLGHNHAGVYAAADHTHTASDVGAYAKEQVDTLLVDKAATDHHHDAAYAPINHDHAGIYSPADHTHSEYAAADHDHAGVYAPSEHDHDGVYAPNSHTHNEYATTDHSHTAAEIGTYSQGEIDAVLADYNEGAQIYTNGAIAVHTAAADPHGDRAHAASLIAALTAADVGAYATGQVDDLLAGKAAADHHHDVVYALVAHNHAGVYSPLAHTHTAADVGAYTTSQVDGLLDAHTAATDPHGDRAYADDAIADALSSLTSERSNYLINGGFDFFQRRAPISLQSVVNGTYVADRWIILTQGANRTQRASTDTGHAIRFNHASTGTPIRFGMSQVVEASLSHFLRGKEVTFQGTFFNEVAGKCDLAILAWTGTADAATRNIVLNWNSMDPSPGSFFLASNLSVVAVSQANEIPAGMVPTEVQVTGTIPSNCNNIICMFWVSEPVPAVTYNFYATQCGLYEGSQPQPWKPRPYQQELALCQRYYEKSFPVDQIPRGNDTTDGLHARMIEMDTSWAYLVPITYKVTKRTNPTITFYNPWSTGSGTARNTVSNTNVPIMVNYGHQNGAGVIVNNTPVAAGESLAYQWAADAEI